MQFLLLLFLLVFFSLFLSYSPYAQTVNLNAMKIPRNDLPFFFVDTLGSFSVLGTPQWRQQTPRHGPGMLRQHGIHHHQRRHALDNGHRAGHHTGVVPPLGSQHALARPVVRSRRLRLPDRRGRFEAHAEVDRRPVRNAALDTAAEVRLGG